MMLGYVSVNSGYSLLVLAFFVNFFLLGVASEQFLVMKRRSLNRGSIKTFPFSISGAYATANLVLACFGVASLSSMEGIEFSLSGVAAWFLLSVALFHLSIRFYLMPRISEPSFYWQCSVFFGLTNLLVQFGYTLVANYFQATYASMVSPLVWGIGAVCLVFLFSWVGEKIGSFEKDGFKRRTVYLLSMAFAAVVCFWAANSGVSRGQKWLRKFEQFV